MPRHLLQPRASLEPQHDSDEYRIRAEPRDRRVLRRRLGQHGPSQTPRARHRGLKNLVGGELKGYTELLQESRNEAIERMVQQAQSFGANAIVNVRFATSSVAQGAAELFAYGTAVRVE